MAIPNTQRDAIETLVLNAGTSPIDLRELGKLELDGKPLHLCGVSTGQGHHSRSRARVAVFTYGEPGESVSREAPCDAAVLLRAPTQEERDRRGSNTALHALDALTIDLADGRAVARKLDHSTTYVPL